MNTSLGYAKRTLNDTSVLLSGGGDKPLSDFIGSISWDSTNKKIKYTPAGASSATDLVTFGSNAFNSTAYLPLTAGSNNVVTGQIYISGGIRPNTNEVCSLGTNSYRWSTVYSKTFSGDEYIV